MANLAKADLTPTTHQNILALVSIIASITSFVLFPIIGIITGRIALKQINITGEQGRTMAIWGRDLGYLNLVLAIMVILYFVYIFTGFTNELGAGLSHSH